MRIGVVVEAPDLNRAIQAVRDAAEEGFSSAWFTQIFGLDAMTVCALAGSEAGGIEVGTAVVPTFPRHPLVMAQQAVTAQAASGGRFALGIGLSHQMVIEHMYGLSYDKPAAHMREYLTVLQQLLQNGQADHEGEHYRVHAPMERPFGDPPPVLVAALAPRMLQVTGELADGTITWMTGPKTLESHIVPSLGKAAADAGRPSPRVVAAFRISVTADPERAIGDLAPSIALYGQLPVYRAVLDREGVQDPVETAVAGDEDHVRQAVRHLADIGVTDLAASPFGTREEVTRTRNLLLELAGA